MSKSNKLPKIIFLGTPDFAASLLLYIVEEALAEVKLVISQPDRPAGRGQKMLATATKSVAEDCKIPVLQPESLRKNLGEITNKIATLGDIDLAVVVAFGQLLPEKFLNIPKHGCLNVHASLLPRWRGAAPIQHSLLCGDSNSGICLMKMDKGLDTGDIYCSEMVEISKNDNFSDLYEKLLICAKKLLKDNLVKIACGEIAPTPQATNGITYAHKIDNAAPKIDWNDTAKNINNKIRAFSPTPGAYCRFEDSRLKILSAQESHTDSDILRSALPGEFQLDKNSLRVKTGDGVIELLSLQPEGKKLMKIEDFLRGYASKLQLVKKLS